MANGIVIDVGFTSDIKEFINELESQLKNISFDDAIDLSGSIEKQTKDVEKQLKNLRKQIDGVLNGNIQGTQTKQIQNLNKAVMTLTSNVMEMSKSMSTTQSSKMMSGLSGITSEIKEMSEMCGNADKAIKEISKINLGNALQNYSKYLDNNDATSAAGRQAGLDYYNAFKEAVYAGVNKNELSNYLLKGLKLDDLFTGNYGKYKITGEGLDLSGLNSQIEKLENESVAAGNAVQHIEDSINSINVDKAKSQIEKLEEEFKELEKHQTNGGESFFNSSDLKKLGNSEAVISKIIEQYKEYEKTIKEIQKINSNSSLTNAEKLLGTSELQRYISDVITTLDALFTRLGELGNGYSSKLNLGDGISVSIGDVRAKVNTQFNLIESDATEMRLKIQQEIDALNIALKNAGNASGSMGEDTNIASNLTSQIKQAQNIAKTQKITVPLDISTKGETLAKRALDIINYVQSTVAGRALEVEVAFTSVYSTKRNNEILEQISGGLNNIDDTEIRNKLSKLVDDLNKQLYTGKGGNGLHMQVELEASKDITSKARDLAEAVQKQIQDCNYIISPEIELTEENIQKLQNQINALSEGVVINIGVKDGDAESVAASDAANDIADTTQTSSKKKSVKTQIQNLSRLKSVLESIQKLCKDMPTIKFDVDETSYNKLREIIDSDLFQTISERRLNVGEISTGTDTESEIKEEAEALKQIETTSDSATANVIANESAEQAAYEKTVQAVREKEQEIERIQKELFELMHSDVLVDGSVVDEYTKKIKKLENEIFELKQYSDVWDIANSNWVETPSTKEDAVSDVKKYYEELNAARDKYLETYDTDEGFLTSQDGAEAGKKYAEAFINALQAGVRKRDLIELDMYDFLKKDDYTEYLSSYKDIGEANADLFQERMQNNLQNIASVYDEIYYQLGHIPEDDSLKFTVEEYIQAKRALQNADSNDANYEKLRKEVISYESSLKNMIKTYQQESNASNQTATEVANDEQKKQEARKETANSSTDTTSNYEKENAAAQKNAEEVVSAEERKQEAKKETSQSSTDNANADYEKESVSAQESATAVENAEQRKQAAYKETATIANTTDIAQTANGTSASDNIWTIKLRVQDDEFTAKLNVINEQLQKLTNDNYTVKLVLEDTEFKTTLNSDIEQIQKLNNETQTVKLSLEDTEFKTTLNEDIDKVQNLTGESQNVKLTLDNNNFNLDKNITKILSSTEHTVPISLDHSNFDTGYKEVTDKLDTLTSEKHVVKVTTDTSVDATSEALKNLDSAANNYKQYLNNNDATSTAGTQAALEFYNAFKDALYAKVNKGELSNYLKLATGSGNTDKLFTGNYTDYKNGTGALDLSGLNSQITQYEETLSRLNNPELINTVNSLSEAIEKLLSGNNLSDNVINALEQINKTISSLGGKNGPEKITRITDALDNFKTAINGMELKDSGFLNQLDSILQKGEELKTLGDVLKSTQKQIEAAAKATSKTETQAENLEKSKSYLSQYSSAINEAVKQQVQLNSTTGETVLSTQLEATKEGWVKVTALIKDATDQYKQFVYTTTNGSDIQLFKVVDDEAALSKVIKQYEQYLRIKQSFTGESALGLEGEAFTPESEGWDRLVAKAKEFGIEMKDVDKVIRNVDRMGSESFQLFTALSRITLGMDSNIVLFQYDEVFNSKKAIDDLSNSVNKLQSSFKNMSNVGQVDFVSSLNQIVEAYKKINDLDSKGLLNESDFGNLQKIKDEIQAFSKDIQNSLENMLNPKKTYSQDVMSQYYTVIKSWEQAQKSLSKLGTADFNEQDLAYIENFINEYRELGTVVKSVDGQLANSGSVQKLMGKISDAMSKNTSMSTELRQEFEKLEAQMKSLGTSMTPTQFSEFSNTFQRLNTVMKQTNQTGLSFFDGIIKRAKSMSQSFIAMYFSIYDIIRYVRTGLGYIKDFDTALTEMRKVSDESVESLKAYQETTYDIADAVGTTAVEIQNSTADWMRLGESLEEAAESAQSANILMNVSEFESIDEATESLVAMSAAYSDLDKMDIVDKLNLIGR